MALLNNSPQLTLSEIIVQLFDNELLADVRFSCNNGDKMINAHSFLLMSRSIVFETDLFANQGVQKIIPVPKDNYESFYEFIRFIYTDACTISDQNVVALLELSVKYKIPKLENNLLAYIIGNELSINVKIKICEFCETENYLLLRDWTSKLLGPIIMDIIGSDLFTTIQESVLKSILKMDFIGTATKPVKEFDLFNALIKWMNHYCKTNGIALSERRKKFDNLIRSIRFSNMTFPEVVDVMKRSENLFTDSEYLNFFKSEPSEMWNCTSRQACLIPTKPTPQNYGYCGYCGSYNYCTHRGNAKIPDQQFQTTETLKICGLRFISDSQNINNIQLYEIDKPDSLLLNIPVAQSSSFEVIVSLGDSFVIQPRSQYRINATNPATNQYATTSNLASGSNTSIVQNDLIKCYHELVRDPRLVEIIFEKP